jgi:hypothetical protein
MLLVVNAANIQGQNWMIAQNTMGAELENASDEISAGGAGTLCHGFCELTRSGSMKVNPYPLLVPLPVYAIL